MIDDAIAYTRGSRIFRTFAKPELTILPGPAIHLVLVNKMENFSNLRRGAPYKPLFTVVQEPHAGRVGGNFGRFADLSTDSRRFEKTGGDRDGERHAELPRHQGVNRCAAHGPGGLLGH